MQYRSEIDGLRAIAVLPVILFHAGFPAFSGGYVGVDVFFVISGFLITSIMLAESQAGSFTIAGFYERRARRILPALFLVTAASAVPAYLWMTPEELRDFGESVISVALFFSNFHFASETGYFAARGDLKPLLHTWSLAVEEQYYLLAPLAFMLLWKRGVGVLAGSTALVAVACLAVAEWGAREWPDTNFFMTPSRIWEIMLGALAAYAAPAPGARLQAGRALREALSAAGLLCILFSVFAFGPATPFPSAYGLVPTIGTVLILLFSDERTLVGRLLSTPLLVGVGLISYSAYLWHQPLFAYARLLRGTEPPHSHFVVMIVLTFILAYASWRLVEVPFRRRRRLSRSQIFAVSGAAMLLLVAAGAYATLSGGVLSRFEGRELAFFNGLDHGMGGGCRTGLDYDLGPDAPCLIGDAGQPPSMVIFGDSHGGPVAAGLGPLLEARQRSALVFGKGRCPPMAGTMAGGIPRDDRRCLQYVGDVLDAIDRFEGIDTIILASRWERYAYFGQFLPLPGVALPAAGSEPAFETGMRATLDRLARDGRRIVILRQVPEPPFDVVARMFDRRTNALDTGRIAFPLPRSRFEELASNAVFDRIERLDVEVFDPYPIFCDEVSGECLAGNDGIPYYRDDNHLWNRGARMLAEQLIKVLEPSN